MKWRNPYFRDRFVHVLLTKLEEWHYFLGVHIVAKRLISSPIVLGEVMLHTVSVGWGLQFPFLWQNASTSNPSHKTTSTDPSSVELYVKLRLLSTSCRGTPQSAVCNKNNIDLSHYVALTYALYFPRVWFPFSILHTYCHIRSYVYQVWRRTLQCYISSL